MDYRSEVTKLVTDVASELFHDNIISNIIDKGAVENYATDLDLKIEKRLREGLLQIIPGSHFIGEESDTREEMAEYTWIVDPIDGTANFVRGIKECCISVGLVKGGRSILGVIYAPWLGELYVASEGEGATLNGKPIYVSDRDFRHSMHYMSAASYNKEIAEKSLGFIGKLCPMIEDVRRFGSAALALANIAAGRVESYFVQGIYSWDICAGLCILTEAGGSYMSVGEVTDLWGGKSSIMAANFVENLEELFGKYQLYCQGKL